MSLAFLAKKSWHTSNLRNVEKVWIAEQKHAAEEKKLAELKKNIEEERQMQELRKLQAAHGKKSATVERLDWMYQGPMASSANERTTEEYLLGKEYKPNETGADARKLGDSAYGALALNKPVLPSNDAFSRLNEDPMMLIRSQQKRAQEDILKNPVKMKRIKGEVEKMLRDKKEKKKAKKAKKKERKHRKSKRSRGDSLDNSDSDSSDTRKIPKSSERRDSRSPLRHYRDRASMRNGSRSRSRVTRRGNRSPRHRSRSPMRRSDRRSRSQDRHRHTRDDLPVHRSRRSRSRSRSASPTRTREQNRNTRHRSRSSSRDSFGREVTRPRSTSPRRDQRGADSAGKGDQGRKERLQIRERTDARLNAKESSGNDDNEGFKRKDTPHSRRHHTTEQDSSLLRKSRSASRSEAKRPQHRDVVVKKPNDEGKYGLIYSEGAAESKDVDKTTLGPNTKFLEIAREKKRQEEEDLRRRLSKSNRAGTLSHEEMVKEAAKMAEDAKARDAYLAKRAAEKRERLEDEEAKLREDPHFLKKLQDEAYINGGGTMEERLRRNSHYIQKRAGAGNFLKKD